jgi:hypothetical protein
LKKDFGNEVTASVFVSCWRVGTELGEEERDLAIV